MFEFFRKLFLPITASLDFIQKYFKSLVFITILLIIAGIGQDEMKQANLMEIELYGPILDDSEILAQIEDAKDDAIKGVLLKVDSPGGSVSPSIEISLAIKELSEQKPVITYAQGTIASGSYYAAIWSDKIISNPGATIGSIGVIFNGANLEELIQKLGIKEQTIKAGRFKEAGTFTRSWTKDEREELEVLIEDTYELFVSDVAAARGLDPKEHHIFADAHIFSAKRAKDVGLIDEIGSISDAKNQLQTLAQVTKPSWKEDDKMDILLDKMAQKGAVKLYSAFSGLKAY